jgi:hypothetical protein
MQLRAWLADRRVDLQTYQKAAIAYPRSVAMTRATPTPTISWNDHESGTQPWRGPRDRRRDLAA